MHVDRLRPTDTVKQSYGRNKSSGFCFLAGVFVLWRGRAAKQSMESGERGEKKGRDEEREKRGKGRRHRKSGVGFQRYCSRIHI